jgi:hypothetical protein
MPNIKRAVTAEQVNVSYRKEPGYRVIKLKNLLKPEIGDHLDAGAVDELIKSGIEVTIVRRK